MDFVPIGTEQNASDPGTVAAPQALLGNGGVAVDLALKYHLDVLNSGTVSKLHDPFHGEQAPVRSTPGLPRLVRTLAEHLAIPLDRCDVGVMVRNLHPSRMAASLHGHFYIENAVIVRLLHNTVQRVDQFLDLAYLLRRYLRQHLQLFLLPAHCNPCGSGGCNPSQSSGIGHYHTFYILDNVGAGSDQDLFWTAPQHRTGQRCGISHCDRFGTPHSRNQFFLQDPHKFPINLSFHAHTSYGQNIVQTALLQLASRPDDTHAALFQQPLQRRCQIGQICRLC